MVVHEESQGIQNSLKVKLGGALEVWLARKEAALL
jgi:hypothetical protein